MECSRRFGKLPEPSRAVCRDAACGVPGRPTQGALASRAPTLGRKVWGPLARGWIGGSCQARAGGSARAWQSRKVPSTCAINLLAAERLPPLRDGAAVRAASGPVRSGLLRSAPAGQGAGTASGVCSCVTSVPGRHARDVMGVNTACERGRWYAPQDGTAHCVPPPADAASSRRLNEPARPSPSERPRLSSWSERG